jgi:adenosylmethionine-8-amino-7-oxononanoate aminotransferase
MEDWIARDRELVWHPYSAIGANLPTFPVVGAEGVRLRLADGRELIDGMASWWCAIHGYNHPQMNRALHEQVERFSHVMFGGLTHQPAVELASRLVELTPEGLETVFFADSGSVSVEVAMKMAIQYQHARGETARRRFLTPRNGYHGDTFGAMSVCDPVNGMHTLFTGMLAEQLFVDAPIGGFDRPFDRPFDPQELAPMRRHLEQRGSEIAAVILEPIVQGAGGMRFYPPDYLRGVRALCDEFGALLICDEIATGFGRSGKLFASEHAAISPDILCLGKALTGGYMTLAATLTTRHISETISSGNPGLFMHGPTFMGNPLACSAALASIELLLSSAWQERVNAIEAGLKQGLAKARSLPGVAEVRVLGAIGVIELEQPVEMASIQPRFVDAGVWVRPFGRLVYVMPPFIISSEELATLTAAMVKVVGESCG